jgi:hypothetical protein
MTRTPDKITAVDYVRSHLKSGDATGGIAEGRELAAQVESDFEAFVKKLKVPPALHDDFYQEVWRAVWAKHKKGQGIDIEKYLGVWLNKEYAWRRPSLRSTEVLAEGVSDSARGRAANGYSLGVSEEAVYGGDSRDLVLASLVGNTPRPKGEWRAADTRREADVAKRMGYDTKAWIAYRRKMGRPNRRSIAGSQRFYSTLSDAGDGEDAGTQRRLWHPGLAPHRRKQVVRRKNARDIFWNPGACQPLRVPTPLQILIAQQDLVCPYCGKRLVLDSALSSSWRGAGGIMLDGCENRRCAALCLCGFWYTSCGVSCN